MHSYLLILSSNCDISASLIFDSVLWIKMLCHLVVSCSPSEASGHWIVRILAILSNLFLKVVREDVSDGFVRTVDGEMSCFLNLCHLILECFSGATFLLHEFIDILRINSVRSPVTIGLSPIITARTPMILEFGRLSERTRDWESRCIDPHDLIAYICCRILKLLANINGWNEKGIEKSSRVLHSIPNQTCGQWSSMTPEYISISHIVSLIIADFSSNETT
jgi:hypothetical protein